MTYVYRRGVGSSHTPEVPTFKTIQEAKDWMYEQVNDPCNDNERFCFLDDLEAVAVYDDQRIKGCCGSFDEAIIVDGKKAMIGCHYGH